MRILFITDILLTGDFVYRLQQEGNEVKLCILDDATKDCYTNLVPKVDSWRNELEWVGKDGLVIFDDVGFGEEQDELRKEGYTVFGGGGDAERMETDRTFGYDVMKQYGIKTVPLKTFKTSTEAIRFVRENKRRWVVKYSETHWLKPYAYIGNDEDGQDVTAVLENYEKHKINSKEMVTLQERIEGIEVGVGRYFNGNDWVGPIEYNVEHTNLFPGDLGPTVDEMGTVAWYSGDEDELLYQSTLSKLKPFLKKANFKGDFDISCIVNEHGAYPLEVTSRFGSPIIHLQKAIHQSPWGEFLRALARGEQYDLKWKNGFGVVISVVIPPFPYRDGNIGKTQLGSKIVIRDKKGIEVYDAVHFDEVASHDGTLDTLYISGTNGYAFYVTGMGKTIARARQDALRAIDDVYVARMFYRSDIGVNFENDIEELHSWGYLKNVTNKNGFLPW